MTDEKKSFWSGATGFVAAVAGLITATGGLIAVLIQVGVIGGNEGGATPAAAVTPQTVSQPDWAREANDICARTNDAVNALPDPETLDVQGALAQGREAITLNRRMLRDLGTLAPPPNRKSDVDEFLRLGASMIDASDELMVALRLGDVAAAQQQAARLKRIGKSFDNSAIGLGATTCAEGASMTGISFGGGLRP